MPGKQSHSVQGFLKGIYSPGHNLQLTFRLLEIEYSLILVGIGKNPAEHIGLVVHGHRIGYEEHYQHPILYDDLFKAQGTSKILDLDHRKQVYHLLRHLSETVGEPFFHQFHFLFGSHSVKLLVDTDLLCSDVYVGIRNESDLVGFYRAFDHE